MLLALLPLVILLFSIYLSPDTTFGVRAALVLFLVLAVARPGDAVLVTVALLGFGIVLAHMGGVPRLRTTELLVVGSLAGYLVRAVPPNGGYRSALAASLTAPAVLFALAALASIAVTLCVYQVQTSPGWEYTQRIFALFAHHYFVRPDEVWEVVAAAAVVEGIGLFVIAAALCRMDQAFFARGVRMLAVGGAGLAVLSIDRLAEVLLRNPQALAFLRATYAGLRISPQIGDYIAAGAYFALCWLACIGVAAASRKQRWWWVGVAVLIFAGLYLTGSRSVVVAAVAGAAALALTVGRARGVNVRRVTALLAIGAIVLMATFRFVIGHDIAGATALESLRVRRELMRTGFRVIELRPIFGVGFERFHVFADRLASPLLNALWQGPKNPHNDFLRFAAELGLAGLGLFLWTLAAPARAVWLAFRRGDDVLLIGLASGLVAFFITSLVSNPLMVREVSYAAWIALGLVTGRATSARTDAMPSRSGVLRTALAVALGVVIVVSIPVRARQQIAAVDLTRVTYGFFGWGREDDGSSSRFTGPLATLFVDGRVAVAELPIKGTLPSGAPQRVEVRVDGRLANTVEAGPAWQRVRVRMPGAVSTSHRIDLAVTPAWVPSSVDPASTDSRLLGIKVGEVKTYSDRE